MWQHCFDTETLILFTVLHVTEPLKALTRCRCRGNKTLSPAQCPALIHSRLQMHLCTLANDKKYGLRTLTGPLACIIHLMWLF